MKARDFLEDRDIKDIIINGYSFSEMLDEYLKINTVKVEMNPGFNKADLLGAIGDLKTALEEKIDQRFKSLKISYE